MLSARTSERNHQIRKSTVYVSFDGCIHQRVYMAEESSDFTIVFQKTDNRFVQTREMIESFVLTGVIDGPAIEDKASAVAARIVRDSFFVGKTHDLYFEHAFAVFFRELFQLNQLFQNSAEVRIFRIIFV